MSVEEAAKLRSLVEKCLDNDPEMRPTATKISAAIKVRMIILFMTGNSNSQFMLTQKLSGNRDFFYFRKIFNSMHLIAAVVCVVLLWCLAFQEA